MNGVSRNAPFSSILGIWHWKTNHTGIKKRSISNENKVGWLLVTCALYTENTNVYKALQRRMRRPVRAYIVCFSSSIFEHIDFRTIIGLDKSTYQVNIFLISPRKHMFWVLIRSASARWGAYYEYPQHMLSWRNKKNINSFGLKKASYQELWKIMLRRLDECKE